MKIILRLTDIGLSVNYSVLFLKFVKQIIMLRILSYNREGLFSQLKNINLFYLKHNMEYEKDLQKNTFRSGYFYSGADYPFRCILYKSQVNYERNDYS